MQRNWRSLTSSIQRVNAQNQLFEESPVSNQDMAREFPLRANNANQNLPSFAIEVDETEKRDDFILTS